MWGILKCPSVLCQYNLAPSTGDLREAPRTNYFLIICIFIVFGQNNMLAPYHCGWPPLGNSGSATAGYIYVHVCLNCNLRKQIFILFPERISLFDSQRKMVQQSFQHKLNINICISVKELLFNPFILLLSFIITLRIINWVAMVN